MAILYFAGNHITGLNNDTKPTLPTATKGATFLETDTDDLFQWDGDSWNLVASNTGTEILSNKSFSDSVVFDEISAPGNAATDKVRIYAKSGGKIYSKDDSGNEYDLTAGAGSASAMTGLTDTDISSVGSAHVLVYDGSNSWDNKAVSGDITIATTGATTLSTVAITGQTAETTIQGASDLVLMYDNSASAFRKVTVSNLLAGGVSADTLNALNDTTLSGLSAAHVLIYDGTDSWDNKAVSGDITINASGVTAIGTDKVTGTMIHANAVDDSSLEQSGTTFRVKATGVTNAMLAGSIAMSKTALVAGTGITLATNTLNVDAAQTQITSVGALNAGSITSGFGTIDTGSSNITTTGTVSAGNLTVTGTTTTVNSTVMTVVDPIIHLQTASGGGALGSDTNKDVGLAMQYYSGSAKTAFLGFDDSAVKLTFIPDATLSSEVASGSVGTIVANLEGDVTGALTGNADTVTNGVYNTGNQTIAGTKTFSATITGDISGNAGGTAATVTGGTQAAITSAANLATVGTIGTGVWNGTALVQAYIGAEAINESKLQVSNAPQNGYVLSAQAGNTGGMTWVAAGAGEANEDSFKTISVSGQSNVVADTTTDTLTLVAGTNMTITTSADTITFAASGASGASESFAIAMAVAL